jgi:hypothetical protein
VLSFQRPLAKGSPSIFEVVKFYQKSIPKAESSSSGSGMLIGNLLHFILFVLSCAQSSGEYELLYLSFIHCTILYIAYLHNFPCSTVSLYSLDLFWRVGEHIAFVCSATKNLKSGVNSSVMN